MANDYQKLGPTGKYPDGKLSESDDGELRFAVGAKDGVVVIDFGKPTQWIGMPPKLARELGNILIGHADKLENTGI